MILQFEEHPDGLVCRLIGQLDMASADEFVQAVEKKQPELSQRVIFDMAQVEFMDSTGIGKLVRIIEKVKEQGGSCEIVHCSEELTELLDLIGVFEILQGDDIYG